MNDPGSVIGFDDASGHLRMRDVLAGANYSEEGLRAALGHSDLLGIQELDVSPALRRTRAGTALDTLIRLFFLGVSVELDAARRALHPMPLESWVGAWLLTLRDGQVAPLVKLLPYQQLLLTADMPAKIRSGAPDDFVLGLGKSSALLAHTVVQRRARRTLDVGTGCGVLTLLASVHSDRVYATDKNPRAAAFAQVVRAGRGPPFRPDHQQSSLRHRPGAAVPVSRQRRARRRVLPAARAARRVAPRRRGLLPTPGQLGARRGAAMAGGVGGLVRRRV